ncbi:MAG: zinc ribbon domain-containing protein [Ruminococcaceae bacterium]|nr:zinc ribbon domain-containing protein [Oscillospiraceae bacterium]
MYCKKCNKDVGEGLSFCPECGTALEVEVSSEKTGFMDLLKKNKLALIIAAAVVVLIGALIAVYFIFLKPDGSKGYVEEVENYLEYFADGSTDEDDFISVAYSGGMFGSYLNGEAAVEINELYVKALLDLNNEMVDLDDYYYGSYEEYDNWKEMISESEIAYVYEYAEYLIGDWELSYEVIGSEKLSKEKTARLATELNDCIEFYEDMPDDVEMDSDDEDEIEEFVKYLEDIVIKEAYEVDVAVEIDGEDGFVEETYEYKVAKLGDEWVILKGAGIFDIFEDIEY